MDLHGFQSEIGQWGMVKFPTANPDTITKHLREEVDELRVEALKYHDQREIGTQDAYRPALAEEAADVLILLLQLCYRCDIDLMEAARQKFAEVSDPKHQWVFDEVRGYAKRLK